MTAIWQAAQHNASVVRADVERRFGVFTLQHAADALGVEVFHRYDLGPDVSGRIVKLSGDDQARVYINATQSKQRQRFTLAHELGHFVERMVEAQD